MCVCTRFWLLSLPLSLSVFPLHISRYGANKHMQTMFINSGRFAHLCVHLQCYPSFTPLESGAIANNLPVKWDANESNESNE